MPTHEEVHADLYEKLNANTAEVKELTGAVRVLTRQNERFFEMMERKDAQYIAELDKKDKSQGRIVIALFVLLAFTLAAVVYGAIGRDGLHAVRETVPINMNK